MGKISLPESARCHYSFGVILRLRLGGHASPVNHHVLKGHFIVIPQDPKLLLTISPSLDLHLDDTIKVFWFGERPPLKDDLKHALLVRKAKVPAALQFPVSALGNVAQQLLTANSHLETEFQERRPSWKKNLGIDPGPLQAAMDEVYTGRSRDHSKELLGSKNPPGTPEELWNRLLATIVEDVVTSDYQAFCGRAD